MVGVRRLRRRLGHSFRPPGVLVERRSARAFRLGIQIGLLLRRVVHLGLGESLVEDSVTGIYSAA